MKTHLYLLTILFISVPSVFAQEIEKETVPGQEPTLVERLTGGKKVIESAEMNFQLFTSANANFIGSDFDGMNFKLMPELEWQYGYLFAWIIMAIIGIIVYLYFRKKKWY